MVRNQISEILYQFQVDLNLIQKCKESSNWEELSTVIQGYLNKLIPVERSDFWSLSHLEMKAYIIENSPVWAVPLKEAMLSRVLMEAGDFAKYKGSPHGGKKWYLRSLELLLDFRQQNEAGPYVSIAPTLDELLKRLENADLPLETNLAVVKDLEGAGEYDKAIERLLFCYHSNPGEKYIHQLTKTSLKRMLSAINNTQSKLNTRIRITKILEEL